MLVSESYLKKLKKFIESNGAEMLVLTNPYEEVRFRANGMIGVIYRGKKGLSFVGAAEEAAVCFENKKPWSGAIKNSNPVYLKSVKLRSLFDRDGELCFFCHKPLNEDVTLEHLLPRSCGGSNHIRNLALAHYDCNQTAHHLSIVEKVKLRELNKETENVSTNTKSK